MISIVDHYYSLACFFYILSCLFFAAIRWFHTCRPYDKHGKYYYPARGLASCLFILAVILLPYAFQPGDNDAWLLVRAFYPLVYFLNCASLLLRYFGKVKKWTKWHRPAIILAVPVGILLILLFVYAISGTLQWSAGEEKALIWSVVVLGAVTSGFCIYACSRVMAWLRMVDTDLYSNPDDFPSIFARKMLFFPLSIFVIVWAVFFIDHRMAAACMQVYSTLTNLVLLLLILHPQRERSLDDWEKEEETIATEQQGEMIDDKGQEVLSKTDKTQVIKHCIVQFVEVERHFLDPHLTIQDVADSCHYGRTYVSNVFKSELGGFFHYVNTLRLQYAEEYRKKHPQATVDDVATSSGFNSRQTLYNVKKRMNNDMCRN